MAWPSPLDRDKHPGGHALSSNAWRNKTTLTKRVARRLEIDPKLSHAINDCWAAGIAVAFDHTRKADHVEQPYPELTVVLRISGGISAATIIIEPPQGEARGDRGQESGFAKSVLLAGIDSHAGELGHVEVPPSTIAERSKKPQRGLGPLKPLRCSCTPIGDPVPRHLEAFASRSALAKRVAPNCRPADEKKIVDRVLADPTDKVHKRALEDIGILIADSLHSSVWMLNPAHITLTGSLAHPLVRDTIDKRLDNENHVIRHPNVTSLSGAENDLIRVRGAALSVLRRQVYRNLDEITGASEKNLNRKLKADIKEIDKLPWA